MIRRNRSARGADAEAGMAWWNGISERERAEWLDRAWKQAAPTGHYTLDSMPSAADAWAAFKAAGAEVFRG